MDIVLEERRPGHRPSQRRKEVDIIPGGHCPRGKDVDIVLKENRWTLSQRKRGGHCHRGKEVDIVPEEKRWTLS